MEMILEVGSCRDNTPSQPSHHPKLTFTGFKTGFAPARAGGGGVFLPGLLGKHRGLRWLWFGTQEPDVRGAQSEAEACVCLQSSNPRAPPIGGNVADLIQMKTRQHFPVCFFLIPGREEGMCRGC